MAEESIPIARAIPVDVGAAPEGATPEGATPEGIAPHVAGPIGARPKAPKPDRPSGLTALAIVNFFFGAFLFLSLIGTAYQFSRASAGVSAEGPGVDQALALVRDHPEIVLTEAGFTVVGGVLLVLAGIGFLRQTRILGRYGAIAYAIVSITGAALVMTITPEEYRSTFDFSAIVSFNFPLLTLALIFTAFRRDLVH